MSRALACLALLWLPAFAAADERPRFASLFLENDYFVGTDRHYTHGMQAAFVAPLEALPATVRALPPFDHSTERDVVLAFGQRIYTPADTHRAEPDPLDRPYAGWLYGLADVQVRHASTLDHVTLTLGVIGPAALARQTQDVFHHATRTRPVQGWGAQLHDEPAFTLGYERAWPAIVSGAWGALRHDLAMRAGATLGNVFTYANAGTVWRVGTALPADLPATQVSLGPPRDGFRGAPVEGWYAWAGADGRAVLRNVFLDGNTFRDSASVKRKVGGYDLQVGIAAIRATMRVSFTLVQRGREFEGQRSPDRFGQLALSLPY